MTTPASISAAQRAMTRVNALRAGTPPYDRPLGAAPDAAERAKERLAAFHERTTPYEAAKPLARDGLSIKAVMLLHRRVRAIKSTADALLDTKVADLRHCLGSPEQHTKAVEALAKAQEAIAMLQAEVARMVSR